MTDHGKASSTTLSDQQQLSVTSDGLSRDPNLYHDLSKYSVELEVAECSEPFLLLQRGRVWFPVSSSKVNHCYL